MTRFARPVRAAELLESPELQLAHPGAVVLSTRGDDEGAGAGYEHQWPHAYAERWFSTPVDAEATLDWWTEQLVRLGWSDVTSDEDRAPRPHLPVADTLRRRAFRREADERLGVDAFDERIRVHLWVDGTWPDGSSDPRC